MAHRARFTVFSRLLSPLLALPFLACTETTDPGDSDGGTPTEVECVGPLTQAAQTCAAADCTATTGLKTFGEAELDSTTATNWIVVSWAASDFSNEATSLIYEKSTVNALTARRPTVDKTAARERIRQHLGEEQFNALFTGPRVDRIRAERAIKSEPSVDVPYNPATFRGTAVRPHSVLPSGVHAQATACSSATPTTCGATALCVIPEGGTAGTCQGMVTIKFPSSESGVTDTVAVVRKVGEFGAIVVDTGINTSVTDAQVDDLLNRFDEHIAPIDHALFGVPEDSQGRDRDGNGVVIIFLTPKVAERGGANLAGFFRSNDLLPTADVPTSNAAEILYMQGPSATVTLDQLSGTIGHEYQHLINFYSKKIRNDSEPEEVWLDEGLATFAEDALGYGSDAFENIAAFLGALDLISLTGNGDCPDGEPTDSVCRRGMAHLFVRYYFEQKGGATFGNGAGSITDRGGAAAVKALVQSASTGSLLFDMASTGRPFNQWLGDTLTMVAIDGQGYEGVSCNTAFKLAPPTTAAFTNYQRGIDLNTAFTTSSGRRVVLSGPNTPTLESETVPVPANGGEVRAVAVPANKVKISLGGSVDYQIGFRALPANK